jgi:hypothetical protein
MINKLKLRQVEFQTLPTIVAEDKGFNETSWGYLKVTYSEPHVTLLVPFPDLLAKADLAMPLTLLGRPSLEGLVHGSNFC